MINYPVSMLTSVSDCDAILSFAAQEQQGLEWKKNPWNIRKNGAPAKRQL